MSAESGVNVVCSSTISSRNEFEFGWSDRRSSAAPRLSVSRSTSRKSFTSATRRQNEGNIWSDRRQSAASNAASVSVLCSNVNRFGGFCSNVDRFGGFCSNVDPYRVSCSHIHRFNACENTTPRSICAIRSTRRGIANSMHSQMKGVRMGRVSKRSG